MIGKMRPAHAVSSAPKRGGPGRESAGPALFQVRHRRLLSWRVRLGVVFLALLLAGAAQLSFAQSNTGLGGGTRYTDKAPSGFLDDLEALLDNLILPNIPGAIMLLFMSSLFSSINFYSAVQSKRRPLRVMTRYLAAWIFFNYLFALIVLVLILPKDMSLSEINKTLFVYCLAATAMPEIAANLKLQLGNSTNAIDLYKYKIKVSDLITERLGSCVAEQRCKELMALAYFYQGRLDRFLDKLAILQNQEDLTREEIDEIGAFAEQLKNSPVDGKASRVIELQNEHHKIVPKLIRFFRDDIRYFVSSPVAEMMARLHPLLGIDEARKLVEAGVTSPRGFLWRGRFKYFRKRLADSTGIDESRLASLYYSTRETEKKRWLARIRWGAVAMAVLIIVLGGISFIQKRTLVGFTPDPTTLGQIVSKPLTPEEINGEATPSYPEISTIQPSTMEPIR